MERSSRTNGPGWLGFIEAFHRERAGITERILRRCEAAGSDPYAWCAAAVPPHAGAVLDVASGSGPIADHVAHWIGMDASEPELRVARARARERCVLASAANLPVRREAVGAATCTMALQILEPLDAALSEIARVVRTGGRVVALVPTTGPLPWSQRLRYVRLQIALRHRIAYPNDRALRPRSFQTAVSDAGLTVVSDERRAFDLRLRDADDIDELLRSLYVPELSPARLAAARRVLAGVRGGSLTVPLRRIVLEREREREREREDTPA